jgi:hypothetical protein
MRRVVLVALAAFSALRAASGQDSAKSKGPTLAETIAWLTTDAPPLLVYTEAPRPGRPGISRRWIHDLRIVDCRMDWEDSHALNLSASSNQAQSVNAATYRALLGDLDAAGIHVKTLAQDNNVIVEFGPRQSKPAIAYKVTSPPQFQGSDSTRRVGFAVRNGDDAKRVVAALKRAATLCGAPTSPF